MQFEEVLYALLAGGGIGFVGSAIGALASYFLFLRRPARTGGPVVVAVLVNGVMVTLGAVVIAESLFSGGLARALVMGVGVFIGFCLAFLAMLALWVRLEPARPTATPAQSRCAATRRHRRSTAASMRRSRPAAPRACGDCARSRSIIAPRTRIFA